MAELKFIAEYKDIYYEALQRTRSLIVDGYWQLKKNRQQFKSKSEDFSHIQSAAEAVLEYLEIFLDTAEGRREKPGVQPLINEIVSSINIHLQRIKEYYPDNKPRTFKAKDDQRSEGKFQQVVFKGEQKIKSKLKTLNIENNMEGLEVKFFEDAVASIPMKEILVSRNSIIAAKVESLNIDWDLIMDNGLLINMQDKNVPDYNEEKHFWDQEEETLQFWVSEWNKIQHGITIDGYHMSSWVYFHLNIFKTPIKNKGNKILNPDYRDNEFYIDSVKTYAKDRAAELKSAAIIFYGARRFAKALEDTEPLYYEDGERPIGDAKVGDKIYGADGKLTNIIGVYPQGEVNLFTVKLGDGREVVCCDEHLWYVYDYQAKIYKTLPLKEIMNGGYSFERKIKEKVSVIYKYWIPLTQPIAYTEKNLPIDPYLLGLWLGGGHSASPRFTSEDSEIIDYIEQYTQNNNFNFRKTHIKNNLYDIDISTNPNKPNPLLNLLRDNKLQFNKHIPDIYFKGSINQRMELLKGLMDTDGTIGKSGGGVSISLANKRLSENILRLCRTLGINSYIKEGEGNYTKKDGTLNKYWTVTLFTDLPVFKLHRKLKRIDVFPNPSRENKKYRVPIVSVTFKENSKATCIRVDNKDKLFLTRDCIVTHNTTSEASYLHHGMLIFPTQSGNISSSNAADLASIIDKIKKSLDNTLPAFKMNIYSGTDWAKNVFFGVKSKSGRITYEHFVFNIKNTDSGSKSGSQTKAGGNPIVSVDDEIGKSDFIAGHNAAVPSFESDDGWVCQPWYTGCLTAGNKVFDKKGNLVKIENLTYDSGIIGYDRDNHKYSVETITHINPPQNKECFMIETNKGSKIECSEDHPILIKHRNKTERVTSKEGVKIDRRKLDFVEAKDVEVGNLLSIINKIDLMGDKEMWNPYLIGALIGDGKNSCVTFSNEDVELWDYIDTLQLDYNITLSRITKLNREYKEARFRGINPKLRELGIFTQTGKNKDLPIDIHLYREQDVVQLIAGLFDTDGTVFVNGSKEKRGGDKVSIASVSEKQVDSLKLLLMRLGIHSNKYFNKLDTRDRKIKSKNGYFTLDIYDKESILIFCKKIPLKISRKIKKLKLLKKRVSGKEDRLDKKYKGLRFERVIKVTAVGMKPVYNLTTSNTHTYIANGIVTHNTSGEEDLSKDAEAVLRDPEEYDFLECDWDILEFGVPKQHITWTRRKFGWFLPAQMSVKTGFRKIETNLAEFLGINSKELAKVIFYKTDWEHNNKAIKKRRDSRSGTQLQQEIVFRPTDPEECFLSAKKNPYPAQGIKKHKEKLQAEGDKKIGLARKIRLFRNYDNPSIIEMELDTSKEINEYPHNGTFTDCPFLLHGDFPEVRPSDPFRFVAGLDDYKQDESNPNKKGSIGAFYIFDRLTRKIVLSLANRPDPHPDFHRQMHMALDAWNCKCFMENEDMDFKKYLDRLTNATPAMYLYTGFDAYDDFSKFQNGNRKFGWRPDKNTVPIVRGYSIDYTKDNLDFFNEAGDVTHTISGYERIDDIQLLEEMVKYKPDGNFDRLVAFGSCLAIDYYLTCKYITPQSPGLNRTTDTIERERPTKNKFFTSKRRSPFSR